MYLPPLLERLGLAQLEHDPRYNRARAKLATPDRAGTPAGVSSGPEPGHYGGWSVVSSVCRRTRNEVAASVRASAAARP
jgi:hypothetical protein